MSEKQRVHVWQPRYPRMVCRHCGTDEDSVGAATSQVACTLCGAEPGAPCVTEPRKPGGTPNQAPPHAVRQRAAFDEGVLEPCPGKG